MTGKEAIDVILRRMPIGSELVCDALDITISALREQEERERGCEYCNDCKSIYNRPSELHNSMDEDVYISGNALIVAIGCHSYCSANINFCSMCGQRLHLPKPTPSEPNS